MSDYRMISRGRPVRSLALAGLFMALAAPMLLTAGCGEKVVDVVDIQVDYAPAPLDFGTVFGTRSKELGVVVTAASTITLKSVTIENDAEGAYKYTGETEVRLEKDTPVTLTVQYTPPSNRRHGATLRLVADRVSIRWQPKAADGSDAGEATSKVDTADVSLSGTGKIALPPQLSVAGLFINFGARPVGSTTEASVKFQNLGDGDLVVSKLEFSDDKDGQFFLVDPKTADLPVTVAGKKGTTLSSKDIKAGFKPKATGSFAGLQLRAHTNDPNLCAGANCNKADPFTCEDPANTCIANVNLIATAINAAVVIAPSDLDLGDVRVGQTSTPGSVEMRNTGGLSINLDDVTISNVQRVVTSASAAAPYTGANPFAVSFSQGPIEQLNPRKADFTFSPTEGGLYTATFTIKTSDGASYNGTLSGASRGCLTVTPGVKVFDNAATTSAEQEFTIKNDSAAGTGCAFAPLTINSATLTAPSGSYKLTPNFGTGAVLQPDQTATFKVEFTNNGTIEGGDESGFITLNTSDFFLPELTVGLYSSDGSSTLPPIAIARAKEGTVVDYPSGAGGVSVLPFAVALSGTDSIDPSPTPGPLTYKWTVVSTPTDAVATFENGVDNIAEPNLLLDAKTPSTPRNGIDDSKIRGEYTLQLVVTSQASLSSAPAILKFTVRPGP